MLYLFVIQADDHLQLLGVDIGIDPRAHRRKSVGALGPPKCPIVFLPGAVADIVAAGVSQDIFWGILCSNAVSQFTDDRDSLTFVMNVG